VEINTFRIKSKQMPSSGLGTTQDEWRNLVGSPPVDKKPCMVLLGGQDFSARGNLGSLVEGLDFAYSESVKVGGISSGQIPGGVWCSGEGGGLFGPDESCNDGDAVGMCMWGNIECEPIVAQGCRPIGDMYEVIEGKGGGMAKVQKTGEDADPVPPMTALRDVLQKLDEKDVELAQNALLVGIARETFQKDLGAGDFLIRQVIGVSVKDGGLVIGDKVKPGQRFRFHVRDRESAMTEAESLFSGYKRKRLEAMMSGKPSNDASGLIMFACNGRGIGLYSEPNYDSRLAYLSTGVPVGGMFCNGELGPIGSTTHLHGFTSVFAVFRGAGGGG